MNKFEFKHSLRIAKCQNLRSLLKMYVLILTSMSIGEILILIMDRSLIEIYQTTTTKLHSNWLIKDFEISKTSRDSLTSPLAGLSLVPASVFQTNRSGLQFVCDVIT